MVRDQIIKRNKYITSSICLNATQYTILYLYIIPNTWYVFESGLEYSLHFSADIISKNNPSKIDGIVFDYLYKP